MGALDPLMSSLELKRLSEEKSGLLVPDVIKFHKDDMKRLQNAIKQDAKGSETISGSLANKAEAVNTVHFSEAVNQFTVVLSLGSKEDTNNFYEIAFQFGEKIIVLQLVKRRSKVQGSTMIMGLTQYRDSFSEFLTWAISTNNQGVTPSHGSGKKLHSN